MCACVIMCVCVCACVCAYMWARSCMYMFARMCVTWDSVSAYVSFATLFLCHGTCLSDDV